MKPKIEHGFFLRIIFPILLVILTILGSNLIPKWISRNEKQLAIVIQNNLRLFTIDNKIREYIADLKVNEILGQLNLLTLRFINEGGKGIIEKDIIKDIEIEFPSNYRILGMPKVIDNPFKTEIIFKKNPEENKAYLRFDLLNKENYFTFDILYIGESPVIPSILAKILDLKKTRIRNLTLEDAKQKEETPKYVGYLIVTFLAIIIIIISLYDDLIMNGKVRKKTKLFLIPILGISALTGIACFIYLLNISFFPTRIIILIMILLLDIAFTMSFIIMRTKSQLSANKHPS